MKAILLLLTIVSSLNVSGQTGYKSGFLLTQDKDTIRGLIRYDTKTRNSTPCFYKSSLTGQITKYAPGTITGFRYVDNQYFISRSIGKSADVFLEVLVEGYMTLYKFRNVYFVKKGKDTFFELSNEMDLVMIEGEQLKKKSRNYTRMLALLMADCLEASKTIQSVPLREKPLIKLITTYNTCMGSQSLYYRK